MLVLIVTDQFDVHADVVIRKLNSAGAEVFRFNVDFDSLLHTKLTIYDDFFMLTSESKTVSSRHIDCVFYRRTFVELSYELKDELTTAHKIWRGEWNKALQGVYHILNALPALNNIKNAFQAENKFLQMDTARKVGLKVPPSVVTNRQDIAKNFQNKHNEIVLKMLYQELYREKNGEIRGIFVNKVSDEINEIQESGENPLFFQKYIEKSYEVRYTIVGEKHFPCRIDSQLSERSRVDWRRYDLPNTPYSIIDPPEEISEKIRLLMNKLGLYYGALDFVVTPDQQWYFLEINPMGQWLWIEDLTGLPISDAIVDWLVRGKDARLC